MEKIFTIYFNAKEQKMEYTEGRKIPEECGIVAETKYETWAKLIAEDYNTITNLRKKR